jgi:hypothetical protein
MMKKITVEKNEGVAEVIDHVLEQLGEEITVVVPKGSALTKSARNFALLRREAEAEGKTVVIESTDPGIMELAEAAGLTLAAEQSFKNRSVGEVSDIVSTRHGSPIEIRDEPTVHSAPASKRRKITVPSDVPREQEESNEDNEEADNTNESKGFFAGREDRFFKNRTLDETENGEDEENEESTGASRKWIGIGILAIIVVAAAAWGVTAVFGKVNIDINFIKTPWQYQATFTADKAASTINASNNVIPAQVFSINKNTTQLFPASAQENIFVKAQGTLTIYNAYSSAPQSLVATTRFVTPDGKIFRLASGVTVPGAKITNGQIVPSSIDVRVVADQSGPSYNIGPVAKLTVPGFANTPKFQGFYGSLTSSTTGGFTGQKAVPTASDIAAAKTKTTSLLQSSLTDSLTGTYPNNFRILDGATSIQVTKLTVNTSTDQNGKFSVFGEATLAAIGFDETAFKTFLLSIAQTTEPTSTFKEITVQYNNVTPDFGRGVVSFTASAQGSLEPSLSTSAFKDSIAGKSISDARTAVASLPQLQNGSISVWPSWLWSIPRDPQKIDISVN